MTKFIIEVNVPAEMAEHYQYLHDFQKHVMYQVKHYNEYTGTAENYNEEISVSKFTKARHQFSDTEDQERYELAYDEVVNGAL